MGLAGACWVPDPSKELAIEDLETYWALDASVGETHYLAPAVKFRLRNQGPKPQRSIQATAVFRRKGEEGQTWGSDWQQVTPSSKPLGVGKAALVIMKSDGRYYSTGTPEMMFGHERFLDATVQIFVRVGPSGWAKMAEAAVERRIGSRSSQGTP